MKKKRNKFVVAILVICCVVGVYRLYPYIFREKGTLYSLKMSKYYKGVNFDTINFNRDKPIKGVSNPEGYRQCETVTKNILDYLNKFELIEISNNEAFKNTNIQDAGDYIYFLQVDQMVKHHLQTKTLLGIHFLSNSTMEIVLCHKDLKKGNKDSIDKYYKINKGKIDINYIYKFLNGAKKRY